MSSRWDMRLAPAAPGGNQPKRGEALFGSRVPTVKMQREPARTVRPYVRYLYSKRSRVANTAWPGCPRSYRRSY